MAAVAPLQVSSLLRQVLWLSFPQLWTKQPHPLDLVIVPLARPAAYSRPKLKHEGEGWGSVGGRQTEK